MRDVQSLVWGPDGCKRRALSNLCPEERDTLDEDTESMEIDDNIDKETPSGDLSVENQVWSGLIVSLSNSLFFWCFRWTPFWTWPQITKSFPELTWVGRLGSDIF